ncbi:MAG: alpha amylase family protein [Armatimonadota bacterium]
MPGKILWCDAEANSHRLNNREGVIDVIQRASEAGINTLIVDVKPLSGEVLYKSQYAPRFGDVDGYTYPEDFDLLSVMVEEGHARGMKIDAGINIFCEGHRQWGRGPAYDNPDWQVISYEVDRTIDISEYGSIHVKKVDPWKSNGDPVVYTRKSGSSLKTDQNMVYLTIKEDHIDSIVDTPDTDVSIPVEGCILALLISSEIRNIKVGASVTWNSEPVFRECQDSLIPSWGIFVNPTGSAAEYEKNIIREIVSEYEIDGIVFDRMRYPNIYADFSIETRHSFESWLAKGSINWPDDIFKINDKPWLPIIPGKYYKEWLEWRASRIKAFAEEAVRIPRDIKPDMEVGIYVGSWYESYYDVGVNWGSSGYHAGYSWMTPEYNDTGYAELFDFICTGCYYPIPTREEARLKNLPEGATVQAGCELSKKAINDASCVYGSLYLRDYKTKPDDFNRAIDTVLNCSDGIMLFDLVYLYDYNWWPLINSILSKDPGTAHR